jgi:putative membrane protein
MRRVRGEKCLQNRVLRYGERQERDDFDEMKPRWKKGPTAVPERRIGIWLKEMAAADAAGADTNPEHSQHAGRERRNVNMSSGLQSRWSSRDILLAAAVTLAGAVALAQQPSGGAPPSGGQQPQQGPPQQSMPENPSATQGNPAQSMADQSFIHKTLEDDVAQEQMGQLAAQKSQSDDVKQFGEKMAQIHQQLTTQLMPVAKKLGVDEPKQPSKKDRQEIEKMQALSGADFDTAFLKAMLKDQQDDLKGFQQAAQGAQDPNVQQLAKMDEPVLNQHLQILQRIAQAHSVTTESEK